MAQFIQTMAKCELSRIEALYIPQMQFAKTHTSERGAVYLYSCHMVTILA